MPEGWSVCAVMRGAGGVNSLTGAALQNGAETMQHEFEFPMLMENTFQQMYHAADLTVRVTIEADETVGLSDWYVSDVEIQGTVPGKKLAWHDLPESHALFSKISYPASTYHCDELDALWAEYIRDEHSKVASSILTNDEHRTY